MFKRFFVVAIVTFFISYFMHYFIYEKILEPLFFDYRYYFAVLMTGLWCLTYFGFALLRIIPVILRKYVEFIMFCWMGFSFILFSLGIMSLPVRLLHSPYFTEKSLAAIVLFTASCLSCYAFWKALKDPSVIEAKVPVSLSLPEMIEQLKIAVISDVHVSGIIGKSRVNAITNIVNELEPDFIFLTGDLMDGSVNQLKDHMEPFKQLKSRYGIVYVTGNHEYYSGANTWKEFFIREMNWNVLSNQSLSYSLGDLDLNILGIEDRHWLYLEKIKRKNDKRLESCVEDLKTKTLDFENQNVFNILLAHQPKDWKSLVKFPFIHLQISGHTHGGQIWPFKFFVRRDQKYCQGLHAIKRTKQKIYVNQGTGFWGPPMRLGSSSEITCMQFVRV